MYRPGSQADQYDQLSGIVVPYQFEPERDSSSGEATSSDEESGGWVTTEDENCEKEEGNRLSSKDWCSCGNCQTQKTSVECICCNEMKESKKINETNGLGIPVHLFV